MADVDWNFLVIGKDERALEFNDETEVVYGVISLGEAGDCLGQYGTSETHFQQVRSGEIREFHTPSHNCTILVKPCAIAF
eukprot:2145778-Heterocapsa_arctica.AAC.1